MKKRNINLSDELWEAAKQAAVKRGLFQGRPVSTSEFVRQAITEAVEWTEKKYQKFLAAEQKKQ